MELELRPYRRLTNGTHGRALDPFRFGTTLLDDFLRLAEGQGGSRSVRVFPLNVAERDDSYHLEAFLPGVQKELVDISVEDGKLSISVRAEEQSTKEHSAKEQSGEVLAEETRFAVQEWAAPVGTRVLALPKDADPEAVRASLSDGILRLEIKKLQEKQPKKVEIH